MNWKSNKRSREGSVPSLEPRVKRQNLSTLIGEGFLSPTSDETAQQVADHYSARANQTIEEREASPIIHLKKLNNWIKSVLIRLHTRPEDFVLDLACGKGGDLIKWEKAKIGYYVGVDIAKGSIEDARNRYNGETDHVRGRKGFSFPARLVCGDCFKVSLDQALKNDAPFDVCSCQFSLHYSWSTEGRARQALANVVALLKPGGYFIVEGLQYGNTVFSIKFDELYHEKKFRASEPFGIQYNFHLEDAVDCPEWLVPFNKFKVLAEEYGLTLVYKKNFHDFVHEYIKRQDFADLMQKLGALGDGTSGDGITADEWDAAYIYMAFVLQKAGQAPSRTLRNQRCVTLLGQEDILYL